MTAYDDLISHVKRVATMGSIGGLLGWDQETMMPPKGIKRRSQEKSLIASLTHEWFTDEKVGKLIEDAKKESLDDDQKANIREIEWEYTRAKAIPNRLVVEMEEATTQAVEVWRDARKNKDFALFAPHLKKIIELTKRYANHIDPNAHPYEVVFASFERGMSIDDVKAYFAAIKERLVPLIEKINDATDTSIFDKPIPEETQIKVNKDIAKGVGYDFEKGRMDVSTHPFTGYMGRITTRYEGNWAHSIMGTIHESGHGMYEHGLPEEHFGTPLGDSVSLSVHEGMSRFWENYIGRSLPFWTFWYPTVKAEYELDITTKDFYRMINQVKPGYIRVDADEVTYTMHIILRFEIEVGLMEGTIAIEDLPKVWNEKMQNYLGITPRDDGEGVLQDTHWASGLLGYFPTYTLGSMLAAQLFAAAQRDVPTLIEDMEKGDLSRLHAWLEKNIYLQGQRYRTKELIESVTGKKLSADDYCAYLESKFKKLYNVT